MHLPYISAHLSWQTTSLERPNFAGYKGGLTIEGHYSLFTFSWPRFESGSLRNGGMLILRIYFAVDGMPIEMYGEGWIAGLLTSDDFMLYMVGFETTRGI